MAPFDCRSAADALAIANAVEATGVRSQAFSEADPHLEIYSDEPPFAMPPPHPFDPMAMWPSTSRDTRVPAKRQWVPLYESRQAAHIHRFVDCIEQGRGPDVNARAAVHHVEVIMAGYASAARGETIALP